MKLWVKMAAALAVLGAVAVAAVKGLDYLYEEKGRRYL